MKSFSEFLLEEKMTTKSALSLLGLSSSYSTEDLKKAYKSAAIKNHPDKGGDLEKMKDINLAFETLSATSSNNDYDFDDRAAFNRRMDELRKFRKIREKELKDFCNQSLKSHFSESAFTKHFESIFGEQFFAVASQPTVGVDYYPTAQLFAEFYNADKTIVFSLKAIIYVDQFFGDAQLGSGSAGGDSSVNMYVDTSILMGGRSVKISQERWSTKNNYNVLSTGETIFPKAKLLAQIKKAEKKKTKFSKRDAILILKKTLDADSSSDLTWFYVPIFDDYKISLTRVTFMGSGAYMTHWLTKGRNSKREADIGKGITIPETESAINWFVKTIKEIKKTAKSLEDAIQGWEVSAKYFNAHREDFYEGK